MCVRLGVFFVSLHVCTYIYIGLYIYMYIRMSLYICIYIYICTYVCVYSVATFFVAYTYHSAPCCSLMGIWKVRDPNTYVIRAAWRSAGPDLHGGGFKNSCGIEIVMYFSETSILARNTVMEMYCAPEKMLEFCVCVQGSTAEDR